MKIELDAVNTSRKFAFYLLRDEQNNVQYAGVCQAGQLIALPDARGNPVFQQVFTGIKCVIEVVKLCDHKHHALNARGDFLKGNPWPYMNRYSAVMGRRSKITCNETGETFNTLKEIVAAHGGAETNLSKHLNGHSGYRSVLGKTYTRGKPNIAVPSHSQPTPPPAPVAVPLHKPPVAIPLPQPVTGDKK